MDLTLTPAAARAPGAGTRLRPRGPAAARGRVRGGERPRPARLGRPDPPGRDRGAPPRRLVPGGARRPGLVGAGAGAGPRAARAEHGRPVVVHPGAVQRPDPLRRRAARPLPRPLDARRALGELRDHRGRRRLGCPRAARDRGPRRGHRRVRPQRREVVRDRAGRHGLHDLPRQRRRRRPRAADAVPRRLRRPGRPRPARPRLHAHLRRPPSAVRPRGRPGPGRGGPGRRRAAPTS